MSRLTGLLLVTLLFEFVPNVSAQTELQRARQMLMDLFQQVRESAEAALREKRQPEFSLKDYNQRLLQVQSRINDGIMSALNRHPAPSAEELQSEMREAVGLGITAENKASAFSFQKSNQKLYVVAYALGALVANSQSWIGVFGSPGDGKPYSLLASVDNSLPDKTIAIQPLGRSGKSGLTFLAHGINWGDAHNRLTLIAYTLDGNKLKVIWSRADLPQGEVKVRDGKIELNFLSSPLGPGHKSVHPLAETWRVTPAGIRLESK